MRILERHPINLLPKLERTPERDSQLEASLSMEIEDALTARRGIDRVFNEARRQYNAIPKYASRMTPVPNAPNIEVPLGAILADDIFAQATDTLFTASPLLIVRPVQPYWVEHAKIAQDWVNWLASNELDLRHAVNNALLDDAQLGTGVYYIPFVEETKKDKVYRVTYRSPRMFSISPEDLILPPGSRGDVQRDRWVALRFWYTRGELEERATKLGWDIEGAQAVAQFDLVRMQHEQKAHLRGALQWREVYEIVEVYCYYDYDGDGLDEDLLVTWDRASRKILNVTFNPYDIRPIEVMQYQQRAHLPYGIGIMEMVQPLQEETTEIHMSVLLNMFLANCRAYVAKETVVQDNIVVTPGKIIRVATDDVRNAFAELKFSDVYPSGFMAQQMATALAERRVGTGGAQGFLGKGGSRTPGVTALSLLQQVNRRFAPAFDAMREKTAAAVRQGMYRYRERLLMKDQKVSDHIANVVGPQNAVLLEELLTTDEFERAVAVEFTAASATINREADRQNSIMLAQLLGNYYQQTVQLVLGTLNQPMPPEVLAVLTDVAKKGTELMDRTMRTFDQVRDPKTFLVDMGKLEAGAQAGAMQAQQQQQMMLMQQVVGALSGGEEGGEGGGEEPEEEGGGGGEEGGPAPAAPTA